MFTLEIKQLLQEGKYDQALTCIDELGKEDHLNGLIMRIRLLERKGNLKEAVEISKQALAESKLNGSKLQQLNAHINTGYLQYAMSQLKELAYVVESAENLLGEISIENQDFGEYQGSIAYLRGVLNFERGETEEALENLEQALLIKQGVENQHDVVETLIQLGWIHLQVTGKQSLALDYFERGLAISEQIGNSTLIAHSFNVLGVYNTELGNADRALTYYEKSSALYQSVVNKIRVSTIYNNISVIYQVKEKYEMALDYYQRFLKTNEELERKSHIALAYGNIGWVNWLKGDAKLMLEHCQRALSLYEEIGNVQGIISMNTSL